jgi:hypothetical protein
MRAETPIVEELCRRFYGALEDTGLELTPEETGKFIGMLAGFYNSTGEIPSKNAMKVLLRQGPGS